MKRNFDAIEDRAIMGNRAWNCLCDKLGCHAGSGSSKRHSQWLRPGVIAVFSRAEILDMPNCSDVTVNRIGQWLGGYGLSFRGSDENYYKKEIARLRGCVPANRTFDRGARWFDKVVLTVVA